VVFSVLGLSLAFVYALGGQLLLLINVLNADAFHTMQSLAWVSLLMSGALLLRAYYMSRSFTSNIERSFPIAAITLSLGFVFFTPALGVSSNFDPIYFPEQFESAEISIANDAWIVAVELNDEIIAYPVEILKKHWIISDTIGGDSFIVAFCNSCNSPLAYRAQVSDSEVGFAMIGIYKQDPLIEDSGSGSWWNTGTGLAVSGSLEGQELERIPATMSEWGQWIEIAPHTKLALVTDSEER
jgi:hypothetical protein